MILLDPTEARDNTRLPSAVIRSSIECAGLEHATGADFIISPLSKPKLTQVTAAAVHQVQLATHCKAGILVQRKDGRDFLSSIPDLASIQERMTCWSGKVGPIMLIIGHFERDKNNRVRLDGKLTRNSWSAYSASKLTWQARGGLLAELSNAQEITAWVNWLHGGFLSKIAEDKLVIDHPPVQALIRPDNPWWSPLIVFPHIGERKAKSLASWLDKPRRTLGHALAYLSDMSNLHLDNRPADFGPSTFDDFRTAMGLRADERIAVELYAPGKMTVTWPADSSPPTGTGRYVKLPDGRIQAIYTREQLETAIEIMTGVNFR